MKALALIIAAAIGIAGADAQTTTRLSATKANEYGITYTLPVTVLDITLEARTTVKKPGRYYKYARRYLNISDPIATETWSVEPVSATITTRGIQDTEQRYLTTFKSGVAPYMLVDEANLPLSINTDRTYKADTPTLPTGTPLTQSPLDTPAGRQAMTEDMINSQSDAKGAELAAARIFELREQRNDLISGNAENTPPDGASLKILLDNLEAQENALMALFVGTTQTRTDVTTVSYTPDGEDITDAVIARISALDGFVAPDDLSGMPVTLTLRVTARGEAPVNDKGVELPFPKNGLAYCIPGQAEVTVKANGRKLTSKRISLAQDGVVYGLNPNSFTDKKAPIYVIFNPATGGIVEQGPAEQQNT